MRVGAAAARASADGYAYFVPGGKDVTRRLSWKWAKVGMFLLAVEKTMGLRPGQRVEIFGVIEILEVCREPLYYVTHDPLGAAREGFPEMLELQFVDLFCMHMGGTADDDVTRVVFRHVDARRVDPALRALTGPQARMLGVGNEWAALRWPRKVGSFA
jgi:hypothetical protein